MGKHRVYEIAKELGKTNQEVIDVLAKNNIQVKSLSTVDDSAKDLVVRAFTKKPVQPEKKPAPQPKPQNNAPKAAPVNNDNKANVQKHDKPQVQNQPKAAVPNKPQQDNRPKNQPNNKPANVHNDQRNQNQNRNNNQNQNQKKNNQPMQQQGKGNPQGQHNKNNKPNRPQRPQGGIFIGPRDKQQAAQPNPRTVLTIRTAADSSRAKAISSLTKNATKNRRLKASMPAVTAATCTAATI